MTRPRVKLLVSIDTEEDDWTPTRDGVRIDNIESLPRMHDFLVGLGLRPTYFVDHPVARTDWAAAILREIQASGRAEVGAHLHPWNTPPYDEAFVPENTMMRNLPVPLQAEKLRVLRQTLGEAVGRPPTSFRAGRFGLGAQTVPVLIAQGFLVDSSVTPFVSWRDHSNGGDFSDAPARCYRLDGRGPLDRPVPYGSLCEVPLSCGFTRHPFGWRSRVHRRLTGPALRRTPLAGLAARTGLIRRVIGSPETNPTEDLLALARGLVRSGVGMLHVFFHSPSLVPGLSPFVQSRADLQRLHDRLAGFVEGVAAFADPEPATVGEAAEALCA